jgi:pantoate--beta-alanine ligase
MSSRNGRLTPGEKEAASIIYSTLSAAKLMFATDSADAVNKYVEGIFASDPIFELEYFTIADEDTLEPVAEKAADMKYRAFIAVFVNNIRLIDTISLN